MKLKDSPFFKYFLLIFFAWTLLSIVLLIFNQIKHKKGNQEIAIAIADAYFTKDLALREWVASHGGIYVEIDSITQPNENLSHIEERDITSAKGKELTLMNPAYMIRQFNEYFYDKYGLKGHITRLNPVRKENAPDNWEIKALNSFRQGEEDYFNFTEVNSEPTLRYMKPLIMTDNCLKCHSNLGYEVGEVGGGISVFLPLSFYLKKDKAENSITYISYFLLWVFGFVGLYFSLIAIKRRYEREKDAKFKEKEIEERYKQLSNLTFEGILLHDNGKVIDANKSLCNILDYSHAELLGCDIIENMVLDKYRNTFRKKISFDTAYPFEIEMQKKGGIAIPVEIESLKTKVNGIEISTTAIRDISNRKKAEATIEKVQKKLNLHFELTPLAVIEWDLDFKVVRWNKSAERIFGFSFKDVIGKRTSFLMPESDKKKINELWICLKNMKLGARSTNDNLTKEGKIITCNWYNTPLLDNKGNLIGVASMAQDITKQKKAEKAIVNERRLLRTLIDNLPDAISVKDLKMRKLIANRVDLENMGVNNEEEVIGKTDFDYFPQEVATKFYEDDKEVLKNNKSIINKEEYIVNPNGRKRWLLTSKLPLVNHNKETIGLVGIGRDITEQKKVESALFEAEQNIKLHIENTPLAVMELDTKFRIVRWNKSAERMFGYSYDEVCAGDAGIIFTKKRRGFNIAWEELLLQKGGTRIINENKTKIGKIIICKWHNTPLVNTEGRVIGVAAMVQDITKQKQLEEERERYINTLTKPQDDNSSLVFNDLFRLNEIQKLQDQFADAMGIGSIITNTNGIPITKGSNFSAFCNLIRSTDKGMDNCLKSDSALGQMNKRGITIRKCLSSGLWEAGTRITVGGKHVGNWLIGQVRDNSHDDTQLIDYARSIGADEEVAAVVVKDITVMTQARFKKIGDVLCTLARLLSSIAYQNIQQARFINELKEAETKIISKNNDLRCAEEEIRGANEELIITNQALHNNMIELEGAIKKAEESDRLKSAFLANMSHEIRTPMNGIIGFTQLLNNPKLSLEKKKDYSDVIINSSEQLLSIVNDILDISRIETGQIRLSEDQNNINLLFDELELFFKPKVFEKDVDLFFINEVDESKSTIVFDKGRLRQVLVNLISNALKFTEQGFIRISCKLVKKNIQFSVKDTGIGINKKFHGKIFQRFQQINRIVNEVNSGTGLGLAISKGFVELMGGKIWIESEIGKGSEFSFAIPFKQKKMLPDRVAVLSASVLNNLDYTILVAEDVDMNFKLIKVFFEDTKVELLHVRNGKEAVEKCRINNHIDLVLMDIKMPIMDGYEATRIIKELRPDITIIAQTAFAFDEDKEKAYKAGCDGYISKPVEKETLFRLINSKCKNKSKRDKALY